jgi:hypothetical protein
MTFFFYIIALSAACTILLRYGGREGFATAALIFTLSVASQFVAMTTPRLEDLQIRLVILDGISLAVKVAIAMLSSRRWPIWIAAFQLNTVLAETAIIISPVFRGHFYYALATLWAAPTVAIAIIGPLLDRRHERLQKRLSDHDGSNPGDQRTGPSSA